jgi:NAD(P)-dependent dehydrogenase (short-subunit alcohol dehydrogenase family)
MNGETVEQRLGAYRAASNLSGKTAVVLGAASAIGKARAEALAALGTNALCADKNRGASNRPPPKSVRAVKAQAHVIDAASADDIARLRRRQRISPRIEIAMTTPAMHIRK